MTDTLPNISPSYSSQEAVDFKILEADFGDGYSQRAADGLNSKKTEWSIVWENRENADIALLYNFLIDKLGYEAFYWTPPGESVVRKWIARGLEKTPVSVGYSTLTTEFEEVFDL